MGNRIYLDNNASAPLDPVVAEEIRQRLSDLQGNPSSSHAFGQQMRSLITECRDDVASVMGVKSSEIIFTSGGTEGVNMAMQGIAARKAFGRIITSVAEHSCVIESCKRLSKSGHTVVYLEVGENGTVSPDDVRRAMTHDTCLVALMAVNNETGVKTDINSIAPLALSRGIPLFVDAVSQLGKEPIVPWHPGVTAAAYSGHKFHALQGSGFLYLRSGNKIEPLIVGGEQEYGRRAGTENIVGIISMAGALRRFASSQESYANHLKQLRDRFESRLLGTLQDVFVNGAGQRASNISNLAFLDVDGEAMLMMLDNAGVSASHGSACSSGALEPSRVLSAMGLPIVRVRSSIRFSFSRMNTVEEIDRACGIIEEIVHRLRKPRV